MAIKNVFRATDGDLETMIYTTFLKCSSCQLRSTFNLIRDVNKIKIQALCDENSFFFRFVSLHYKHILLIAHNALSYSLKSIFKIFLSTLDSTEQSTMSLEF